MGKLFGFLPDPKNWKDPAKAFDHKTGNPQLEQQMREEAEKAALRDRINTFFTGAGPEAQFKAEEDQLSGALRGKYGDELGTTYQQNERGVRFGAANTGNIGGSTYADTQAELEEQNRMGGTRIEEAVRRAVNGLRTSREDTRLRSIGLVNAGSGQAGVDAATSGLKNQLDAANSANREDLFSDLFSNLAYSKVGADQNAKTANALAFFTNARKSGLSPKPPSDTGGRIF